MIICIVGPTAVGKTKLSLALAKKYNGEIINADSVQVYKGLDIGSAKVTKEECELIVKGSKEIISEAIKMGGTTIKSYTSSLGVTGRFQQKLKVHKKEGEACVICNTPIVNIKIGGRSTYYCPHCQK